MKRKLKTKTLCIDEQPTMTILKGRHTHRAFEKATKAEGWSPASWNKDMVSYKWLRKKGNCYKQSDVSDLKAELYTVGEW